jgi:hypothetical protein
MPGMNSLATTQRAYARRRLRRTVSQIEQQAQRAIDARARVGELQPTIAALPGRSGPAATATLQDQVGHVMHLLLPLAIYVIDVVLLSAALEYAVRGSSTGALAALVPFTFPAGILVLEMWLAGERHVARLSYLQSESGGWAVAGWTFAAIACSAVVEAPVAAWVYSREMEDFDPWVSIPMIVGIVGLPFLAHLAVALSGERANASKAWLAFVCRRYSLNRALTTNHRLGVSSTRSAGELFARYTQDLERFNAAAVNDRLEAGPFHRDTQALLREYFGAMPGSVAAENTQTAAVAPPPQPPPEPPAPSPSATDGVGHPGRGAQEAESSDSWSQIFARQVREAESEVRS